ncbi:MAG: hypothetical protein SGI92_12195 [Bryobacteraceae bacterium]|nr:hypothetical protein [Bryobacteraceae bacterium]
MRSVAITLLLAALLALPAAAQTASETIDIIAEDSTQAAVPN